MERKTGLGPKGLRWMIWVLILLMVIVIGLSWIFYAESYEFFGEATSYLGGFQTWHEKNPNNLSQRIFTIGFLVIGIYSIFISLSYFLHTKEFRFALLKGILLVVIGFGALGIAIPHDIGTSIVYLHSIGAFMFLSGLAVLNFTLQILRCVTRYNPSCEEKNFDYYIDYSFVVILILAAIFYFLIEVNSVRKSFRILDVFCLENYWIFNELHNQSDA